MEKVENPATFEKSILAFNTMYNLPINKKSWENTPKFLHWHQNFRDILEEEIEEGQEIRLGIDWVDRETALCDWLGDLLIYCASESVKYDAFSDLIFAPHEEIVVTLSTGLGGIPKGAKGRDIAMITKVIEDRAYRYLDENSPDPRRLLMGVTQVSISGFAVFGKRFTNFSYWEILDIIMQSNFSKLGEDGKPIYDERGKIMKGPGYWKPEPKIAEYLSTLERAA